MAQNHRIALAPLVVPLFAFMAVAAAAGCDQSEAAAPIDAGRAMRPDLSATNEDAGPPEYLTWPDMNLGKAGPPYPIVLIHGMAGFKNIGPIDYFYGVPDALRKDGHDVWVSQQDPINDSEVRGAQALAFVEQVMVSAGKAKVNLIAHSQGGYDARYVASAIGNHVASCTLIASPMLGDPIADLALSGGPGAQAAIDALLNVYGAVAGYNSNAKSQIAQLSAAGAAAFFAKHPDSPSVAYYSIAGRSAMSLGASDCATESAPPWISRYDGVKDPLDLVFQLTGAMLDNVKPRPIHDGVVTVASARHGTFLGCVPADHMDEVNQLVGDSPGFGNSFDALRFYRDLADWLVTRGY